MKRESYSGIFILVSLATLLLSCAQQVTPESRATPIPIATTALPAKLGWEENWKTIVDAAKKEGELRIYSSIASEARTEVISGFKEKFGIKIEFVTGLPADLIAKVLRERRANLYLADVFIEGASAQIVNLKSEGIIEPLEPILILPEVKDPKVWRGGQVPFLDKDKLAISFVATRSPFILRNTNMVKSGEITSYRDLLKPQWKGKIVMFDPTTTGPMATFFSMLAGPIWDIPQTKEYLQELAKQEPFITRDNRLIVEWVARGKYALGMGGRPEIAASFWSEGAPIEEVRTVEGILILSASGCVSLANNAPHPQASRVFINWLLSQEGQTVFARGYFQPSARLDIPTTGIIPMLLPQPGEKIFLEAEDNILLRTKMIELAKEVLAPLLK